MRSLLSLIPSALAIAACLTTNLHAQDQSQSGESADNKNSEISSPIQSHLAFDCDAAADRYSKMESLFPGPFGDIRGVITAREVRKSVFPPTAVVGFESRDRHTGLFLRMTSVLEHLDTFRLFAEYQDNGATTRYGSAQRKLSQSVSFEIKTTPQGDAEIIVDGVSLGAHFTAPREGFFMIACSTGNFDFDRIDIFNSATPYFSNEK